VILQQAAHAGYSSYASTPIHVDSCQIVVPDKAVGAIIGAGGTMIKQIMEDSGAHVTVRLIYPVVYANSTNNRFFQEVSLYCSLVILISCDIVLLYDDILFSYRVRFFCCMTF